ncbi:MAG: hypothetical protein UU73_C0003G0048 [Candidatus Daviesbacteria bacterium GW2011_GWA1_41_61]|uniref:Uncharacterized protein n=1 Tax=Candidatus Daviesbacteria bacterium GW2011_GWA2_40_9 TaxID=1618424 RepID=A0A0G0WG40_9BACT|nr:MAG: hypothetical protein UU26_C0005G0008 [Candidatus Daviesbacteria bacterium GW2011_GWC1_40_9]KKR83255.1 MAG: hypothetical protein UU29_C0007G0125 [Candidatus Daviesbacteria bacterium GW2011_GWA2_40_9]KKR93600.1 MAG: hypothetical protein UU44_C0002G0261 [Candidatus Daviesbacteria bacterium GW2011_GWB1_41_15]KKS14849.1 MAG: hypothetical protein UU73_C0003G0048 [Candidatus Daviesbacteria bacterium GW2011_GWA1_41_61]
MERGKENKENEGKQAVREKHYSEKGGHFLRGRYWKAWGLLGDSSGLEARSTVSVPMEINWQRRRFMPRYSIQDGRR